MVKSAVRYSEAFKMQVVRELESGELRSFTEAEDRYRVKVMESRGLCISMTEENHCAENAQAERLNGILKQEYGLGETFQTKEQALAAIKDAVSVLGSVFLLFY